MSTIERLCGGDFAGRRAGSPEHRLVVDYLARRFDECGLSALNVPGTDGYKQPLTMRYSLVRSDDEIKAVLSYRATGKRGPAQRTKVFAYRGYNGRGGLDIRSQVVFVGHGIRDPASGRDDYAGLDVSGKVVLWMNGEPKNTKLSKPFTGARKMLTAYQLGAAACLVAVPKGSADQWGTNVGLADAIADFPCIAVDEALASDLLSRKPAKLRAGAVGAEVRLQVTPVCDPQRSTYNVIAVLPGSDQAVAHEVVMVGAHYDHLGRDGGGRYFPGADDNASGTAVVLETARAIRRAGLTPRRTIVFAAWTGEEAGLVGSNYFVAHPPFPLKEIVSNIELDMVGSGTPGVFATSGASAFPDNHRFIATSARDLGLKLKPDSIVGASDNLAFARKKSPTSLISACGEHPNYHTGRDAPAAINRRVLESAARLAALSVWRAANG